MEVLVLDVGHGNGSIVRGDACTLVIDAPLGSAVVEALISEGLDRVDAAFASHSDADHLGGLIALLLADDVLVAEVRCNPDAMRRSKFWDDFKVAAKWAKDHQGTRLRSELTIETTADLVYQDMSLEVLYPPAHLAISGVGGLNDDAREMRPNEMSAVLRLRVDGEPLVLFTGDLDASALRSLVDEGADLRARTLVFPHHGGAPGERTREALEDFAATLGEMVDPETVVFSIGRTRFRNPQPSIVAGLRRGAPDAHIACTQLSRHCSESAILGSDAHLAARYAAGRAKGHCCAGTVVIRPGMTQDPLPEEHLVAISGLRDRLCK